MSSYRDNQMQSVLDHLRRYSKSEDSPTKEFRAKSPMVASAISRRQSNDILMSEVAARRLSEAGVNRRPSAALVLTEDTDSFIVGDRVFVDGIKPGRIQFIGKTAYHFSITITICFRENDSISHWLKWCEKLIECVRIWSVVANIDKDV